uniref:Protein kinase domain-containing protein n=1 Tax=Hyaloperonospora arabidopsidis (strain Emoy2) TaxID=559515 RepID=M4BMX9_HYAAE
MTEKEQFLAREQPPLSARPASSRRLCSAVTFFPLYATERLLSCLGYSSPSIRMQSGRTGRTGGIFVRLRGEGHGDGHDVRTQEDPVSLARARAACPGGDSSARGVCSPESDATRGLCGRVDGSPDVRVLLAVPVHGGVRIPEVQILDLFLQICRAVAELHSKSPPLAHRDIKPENIMLSDEGEPVLTDFGSVTKADVVVSRRFDALVLQELAAQQSSMAYRAPELYDVPDDAHISSATDVWSLGCLLYAMAFGYSPFECSFYDSGVVRVVECTYLAVIGPIKFPKNCSYSSKFCDMIRWILTQDASARPSVFQVIEQLHDGV